MGLKNSKFYKNYFIKLLVCKLVELLIELLLIFVIIIIIILLLTIYWYIFNYNNDVVNCLDISDIKSNKNLLKQESNKFISLFKQKDLTKYSSNFIYNTIEYKFYIYRKSTTTCNCCISNKLNNLNFNIYKENEEIKSELYSLKLQISELEKIGTDSLNIMHDFSKFWKEFKNYLNTDY